MHTRAARSPGPSLSSQHDSLRHRSSRAIRRTLALATGLIGTWLHAKLGLVAHRGESFARPENTLSAFAAAKAVADYVEFDVRVAADGVFVVMHDESVDRTTNGRGRVAELTSSQILQLDAGMRFGAAFAGEKVPSAHAALAEIVTDAAPMMEFKSGTVAQAIVLLRSAPWRPDGMVLHFDLNWLLELKRKFPSIQACWLGSGALTDELIKRARDGGVAMISWRHSDLTRETVERVGRSSLLLYAWTVNDAWRCAQLRTLGVDGVVVDAVARLAQTASFRSPLTEDAADDWLDLPSQTGRTVVIESGALARNRRKVTWRRANDQTVVGRGGSLAMRIDSVATADLTARWTNTAGVEQIRRFSVRGDGAAGGLSNLSARAVAGEGDATAVVGWVTGGGHESSCLLRGVGPSLRNYGVASPLESPEVRVFAGGELVLRVAGEAAHSAEQRVMQVALGAFALAEGGGDAVYAGRLGVGVHTAHLVAADRRPGVGLLEIYRASGAELQNLSFRGWCPPGGNLVAGFVIEGGGSRLILIRGVGPGLRPLGVSQALADPWLRLFDARGRLVAASDDWSADDDAGVIAGMLPRTGAPDLLRPGGRDAAIALNLPSGAYTVVLESTDEAVAGVGLIEVFDLATLPEA